MKVYAGGAVNYTPNPDVSIKEYDASSGSEGWSADHGALVRGVATDDNGNVYIGGYSAAASTYYTTRKLDSAGNIIWSKSHANGYAQVYCIAVDSSGNVFTGGGSYLSNTTRKYDNDGNLLSSANHGAAVYGIATDSSGNVFAGGATGTGSYEARKYNNSLSLQWSVAHGAQVNAVAMDSSGNCYLAGAVAGESQTIRKYNSSGTLQWSAATSAYVQSMAVDSSGNVYVCGGSYLRKFDSGGTEITTGWAKTTGFLNPSAVCVDSEGNVYLGGVVTSSTSVYKYNSAGTLQWSANQAATVWGIAVYEPPPAIQAPSIPIPLAIGTPTLRQTFPFDAITIPLAIGIPTISGGLPLVPPAFPDGAERVFYRAYLTGGDTLLEIPMASFQCKRRRGASTWLVVESPGSAQALVDLIRARIALGASILIYCGTRDAAGTESVGELLRATMTDTDYARSTQNAPLQVTARVDTPTYTLNSRVLLGVSKRGKDTAGRRMATCLIDPLLRPGDEVDDGLYTPWIVGALEYQVSPFEAMMTVVEES